MVEGQLRSYNKYQEGNNKLILTIFARNLKAADQEVKIQTRYFWTVIYARSPFTGAPFGREITDMLLAVNRPYNKSDYIPCIAWGRNARYSENLKVGKGLESGENTESQLSEKRYPRMRLSQEQHMISISKMEVLTENTDELKINRRMSGKIKRKAQVKCAFVFKIFSIKAIIYLCSKKDLVV